MANFFKASPKKQVAGQTIQVQISRLDFNGCGVGQYQNKAVFIDGALPDETVSAKIIEQKSKYTRAQLIEVIQANQDRIDAHCQHFLRCGGCDLQHLAPEQQLIFKRQKVVELFARHNISDTLPWQTSITSQPWHYRRKARIGVQYNKAGQALIGFRQKSTNQLSKIKQCPVLVPSVADLFTWLNVIVPQLSRKNPIGHIEVIATDKLTLVVRQLVNMSKEDQLLWSAFSRKHQLEILIDNGKTISLLRDAKAELVEPSLQYSIDEIKISFVSQSFIQVNQAVNEKMIKQALQWLVLSPQDTVLDLFCGLGNFSLPIAKLVTSVVGIEGVEAMVRQAEGNAQANGISNCHFYQADLNNDWLQQPWAQQSFSKALIDPARAGAFQALQQLIKFDIGQLLYVSCDPTTLARDSELLLIHGYQIEKISLIDMFSQTKHIETMVLFVKQDH